MTPEALSILKALALGSMPLIAVVVGFVLNRRAKNADDARAAAVKKADEDRSQMVGLMLEIRGLVTGHEGRLVDVERRVGWHDRDLARLNNYVDTGSFRTRPELRDPIDKQKP